MTITIEFEKTAKVNRDQLKTKALAAATELLRSKGYISMVNVLMSMGRLTKQDHQRWRFRQVRCLENVITGNLSQLDFLLRTVRAHARDVLRLKPSRTVYTSWSKGRRELIRFSKTGNPPMEEMYSTHYIDSERLRKKTPGGDSSSATMSTAPETEVRLWPGALTGLQPNIGDSVSGTNPVSSPLDSGAN